MLDRCIDKCFLVLQEMFALHPLTGLTDCSSASTAPFDNQYRQPPHSESFPSNLSDLFTSMPGNSKTRQCAKNALVERPYNCTYCPRSFILKHHLKQHLRLHTGERPFVCTSCGKSFVQQTSLHNHTRSSGGCVDPNASSHSDQSRTDLSGPNDFLEITDGLG